MPIHKTDTEVVHTTLHFKSRRMRGESLFNQGVRIMGSIESVGNTMMQAIIQRAQQFHGMALVNLLDVSRKVEMTVSAPLGTFGIGGMVDLYA